MIGIGVLVILIGGWMSWHQTHSTRAVNEACPTGTERVGEGCMPLKDACEMRGDGYSFDETTQQCVQKETDAENYQDVAFRISGETVRMKNGEATTATNMGSASQTTVRYFGNTAKGDLNGDGIPDLAFLITQQTGGSGMFYYAVGAIQNAAGHYMGTDAVLIGDRIAPQTTEIRNGILIVNYADRAPGEPMAARPTVGKSMYLKLDAKTMQFGEVVQNFEDESASGNR